MSFRPGDRVLDYEVLQVIGRGAHGVVLKVHGPPAEASEGVETGSVGIGGSASSSSPPPLHRVHALKVLHCDGLSAAPARGAGASGTGATDCGEREAAFAEARLLQRLRYPHIVGCEDVFWDSERQAVMLLLEFMDGGDLQTLIDTRRYDVLEGTSEPFGAHFARRVLAAVGGALAYVHARGVLHRDVKPANVLLTRHSQRIKLADFGIAKILETTANANTVVGTPYYLSPEIVMGQPYGEASDCWALGVLLYEVATLRRPFDAGNQLALVRKICEEQHAALPDDVEPDIAFVVEGLLAKSAEQRLTLQDALAASEAVAALVVPIDHAIGGAPLPAVGEDWPAEAAPAASPAASATGSVSASPRVTFHTASDSLGSSGLGDAAALAASWCGSEAAAAAREALQGDVDDPEELVRALTALERERDVQEASATSDGVAQPVAALQALESELRLRIAALRDDAAAMLDDLLLEDETGDDAAETSSHGSASDPDSISAVPLCSSRMSSVRGSALEQALEVATSLGVDTDQSEERIARKSRMLSLRVKWGGVARFCMLPVIVGFESLVAEVSRRFGLPHGAALPQLSWREAGESFSLTCQADWEECLQRRGLLAQPGRLELCLEGQPPAIPPQPRPRYHCHGMEMYGVGQSPLYHQRPELFTWRGAAGSQLWASSRRHGATASGMGRCRTGARSPPMLAAATATVYGAEDDEARARRRLQEPPQTTASSASLLGGSRPRSSARPAVAAAVAAPERRLSGGERGTAALAATGSTLAAAGASQLELACTGTSSFALGAMGATSSAATAGTGGELAALAGRDRDLGGSALGKARSRPVVQVRGRAAGSDRFNAASPHGTQVVGAAYTGSAAASAAVGTGRAGAAAPLAPSLPAIAAGALLQVNGRSVPLQPA